MKTGTVPNERRQERDGTVPGFHGISITSETGLYPAFTGSPSQARRDCTRLSRNLHHKRDGTVPGFKTAQQRRVKTGTVPNERRQERDGTVPGFHGISITSETGLYPAFTGSPSRARRDCTRLSRDLHHKRDGTVPGFHGISITSETGLYPAFTESPSRAKRDCTRLSSPRFAGAVPMAGCRFLFLDMLHCLG